MSYLHNILKLISNQLFVTRAQVLFLFGSYIAVRLFVFFRLTYRGKRLFEDLAVFTMSFFVCAYNFLKPYYMNMGSLGHMFNNATLIAPLVFYVVLLILFVLRWRNLPSGTRIAVNDQEGHKKRWIYLVIEILIVASLAVGMYLAY
ncbi:MAG: hypothetical protein OEW15_17925 [Nitrospirota bacterium]|nr:hypothetical protein [Nitrospirota bacterium]